MTASCNWLTISACCAEGAARACFVDLWGAIVAFLNVSAPTIMFRLGAFSWMPGHRSSLLACAPVGEHFHNNLALVALPRKGRRYCKLLPLHQ